MSCRFKILKPHNVQATRDTPKTKGKKKKKVILGKYKPKKKVTFSQYLTKQNLRHTHTNHKEQKRNYILEKRIIEQDDYIHHKLICI